VKVESGRLSIRYETPQITTGKYTVSDASPLGDRPIYVEDSPALQTADWTPSTAPSQLKAWVDAGRVNVTAVKDVDLAAFRPEMLVVSAAERRSYRLVVPRGGVGAALASRPRCTPDDRRESCHALLVSAPGPPSH
jgi:hypothetical protein